MVLQEKKVSVDSSQQLGGFRSYGCSCTDTVTLPLQIERGNQTTTSSVSFLTKSQQDGVTVSMNSCLGASKLLT